MKRFSFYALMLFAAVLNYSCSKVDTPVIDDGKTTIEYGEKKYEVGVVAKLTAPVGNEVSLNLGVYDEYDIYGVDFGDGQILTDSVFVNNTRITGASGNGFKGTVSGDGVITIYGNSDIWYMGVSGGAVPVSFDQEKLVKVQNLSISGADVESISFAGLNNLTQLSFSNSPVRTIDVSKNTELTSINVINTTVSAFEVQLESLDLSNNTKLTSVTLGSSFYLPGKLTSLDLSKNTALETVVVSNNKLQSIVLPAGADLDQLSLDNNELTSVDLSGINSLKNIQIQNNKLTSIDLSKMVAASRNNVYVNDNQLEELTIPVPAYNLEAQNNKLKKVSIVDANYSCKLQNNQLTLATLPAKPAGLSSSAKTKRFLYAPQAALEVPEEVAELDLSDQLTAVGIETEAKTTAYSFVTASGAALAEGTDYEVTAPGKFKFIKAQAEKVHGVMTNEALPLFTGDDVFVTTEFAVNVGGAVAGNILFSFAEGTVTGGSVEVTGGNQVAKEITVSSKKANIETEYVLITLDEALQAGDVIKITGYRKKDSDANGNLYFLYENGTIYDEGDNVVWNNIHENVGQQPNTNTYTVSDAAGSKTIKLARSKSGTNVLIQKIEIVRN